MKSILFAQDWPLGNERRSWNGAWKGIIQGFLRAIKPRKLRHYCQFHVPRKVRGGTMIRKRVHKDLFDP